MVFLPCLLCKRETRLFNINKIYGRTGCPIKNYILEFFGACEEYLHDDHGLCSLCVYLLNNLLYIKKCMLSIISMGGQEDYSNKPFRIFSHVYKHFIKNLCKLNYEAHETEVDQNAAELLTNEHNSSFEVVNEEMQNVYHDAHYYDGAPHIDSDAQNLFSGSETEIDQNVSEFPRPGHSSSFEDVHETVDNTYHDPRSRGGTPYADREVQNVFTECETEVDQNIADLLRPDHSSPFKEAHEIHSNTHHGTPYADDEVQITFARRRGRIRGRGRRRGHNWSRRKRPKSNLTTYSEPIHRRSWRHLHSMNFSEYQESDRSSDDNEGPITRNLASSENYLNGILPSKRSRSVGEQYDDSTVQIIKKYKCINNCSFEFDSLDRLTDHKKEEHGMLAKYVCYECYATKTFASPEDLKLHDDLNHSILISNCPKCSMELRTKEDLQKHLREPHPYSCNLCDMFFVSQRSCKIHLHEHHKGKKKKNESFISYTIVDRTYRREDISPIDTLGSDNTYNGQIIWRQQRNTYVETLSSLCLDAIKRTDQGTVDISTLVKGSYNSGTSNKKDNQCVMDESDNTNENLYNLDIQNQISVTEIANDVVPVNNCVGNNVVSSIIFESLEVVPNIAKETDVYTWKEVDVAEANIESDEKSVSNKGIDSGDAIILTTNDDFERFITNVDSNVYNTDKKENGSSVKNVNQAVPQTNEASNTQNRLNKSSVSNNYFNSESKKL